MVLRESAKKVKCHGSALPVLWDPQIGKFPIDLLDLVAQGRW